MNISDIPMESLNSVKQAINLTMMRKSMNKDAQAVSSLLDSMVQTSAKIMEQSVTPHKGSNVDVSV